VLSGGQAWWGWLVDKEKDQPADASDPEHDGGSPVTGESGQMSKADTDNLRESAKTIRGTLYSILIYSAFCVTAMGFEPSPDIFKTGEITVPILQAKIRYITFFYVAPLILLVMAAYLHLFVGFFKEGIKGHEGGMVLPAIFTLDNLPAKALSEALFYVLTPAVILRFYWVMDDLAEHSPVDSDAIETVKFYLLNLGMVSAGVFFYLANRREEFMPQLKEANPYKIVSGIAVVLVAINVFTFGFIREELKSRGEILVSLYEESPIPGFAQAFLSSGAGQWTFASHKAPPSVTYKAPEPPPSTTIEEEAPDVPETPGLGAVGEDVPSTREIEGYAFYGIYYGGEWSERHFANTNPEKKLSPPEIGNCVKAIANVNVRAGYIEQKPTTGWTNKKWLGVVRPGEEFTVLEVKEVVEGFYWMGFSEGCGG